MSTGPSRGRGRFFVGVEHRQDATALDEIPSDQDPSLPEFPPLAFPRCDVPEVAISTKKKIEPAPRDPAQRHCRDMFVAGIAMLVIPRTRFKLEPAGVVRTAVVSDKNPMAARDGIPSTAPTHAIQRVRYDRIRTTSVIRSKSRQRI
jgi:hypothetical protein